MLYTISRKFSLSLFYFPTKHSLPFTQFVISSMKFSVFLSICHCDICIKFNSNYSYHYHRKILLNFFIFKLKVKLNDIKIAHNSNFNNKRIFISLYYLINKKYTGNYSCWVVMKKDDDKMDDERIKH